MNTIPQKSGQPPRPQSAAPPPKPPAQLGLADDDGWHKMETAPKDGTFVYLLGDDLHQEWYWYLTRQFRKGCWQPVGWWRLRFGANTPPAFTPLGWRRLSEGVK
jgi:hypothetical protein